MKIVAIILTYNEEHHLGRCIESLSDVVSDILVVDSYSPDGTVQLARELGASVVQNSWVNHATQFNWALQRVPRDADWILRIDADEYVTPELKTEIRTSLPRVEPDVSGVVLARRMTFQGRMIHHGGVFPIRVLRLFRNGRGACENRWMDEHIRVEGRTVSFQGELVDDNRSSLTWWTNKHNNYASREAVELLNLEYGFIEHEAVASLQVGGQAGVKRWIKEKIYARLPGGFRAFVYFVYRYVVRFGFLDGKAGAAFHFLQGLWYRYLVDAKVAEVKRYAAENGVSVESAIGAVLNIDVRQGSKG